MYALLTFFAALAMWGLAWLLEHSRADHPGAGGRSLPAAYRLQSGAWAAYIVGSVGALYSHNTAVFLFGGCNLVVLACLVTGLLTRRNFARKWLVAQGVIVVCWSLWLPHMVSQSQQVLADYWIPAPDLDFVIRELRKVYLPFGPGYTTELDASSFIENFKWLSRLSEVLMIGLGWLGLFWCRSNPRLAVLSLAARGRSTFSELRWYPPMEAAKGSLSWVFRAKQPESVRTGP